mmetsp:Transcript_10267/g.25683  ORF Transcript_10267/g.25683 Transcript_10267/m.25683 type:complete len:226 (-) Transcript_10267:113-790(-)
MLPAEAFLSPSAARTEPAPTARATGGSVRAAARARTTRTTGSASLIPLSIPRPILWRKKKKEKNRRRWLQISLEVLSWTQRRRPRRKTTRPTRRPPSIRHQRITGRPPFLSLSMPNAAAGTSARVRTSPAALALRASIASAATSGTTSVSPVLDRRIRMRMRLKKILRPWYWRRRRSRGQEPTPRAPTATEISRFLPTLRAWLKRRASSTDARQAAPGPATWVPR